MGEPATFTWQEQLKEAQLRFFHPKSRTFRLVDEYLRAMIREAEKPFPHGKSPPELVDPYADLVEAPGFEAFGNSSARTDTYLRLVRLELALQKSRAALGHYPARLDELRNGSLKTIPLDPFTEKPFVYRRTPSGYLLYSLGRNLRDDGGKPQLPRDEADGDYVAGHLYRK
jgi:hypothetical protein